MTQKTNFNNPRLGNNTILLNEAVSEFWVDFAWLCKDREDKCRFFAEHRNATCFGM